MSAGKERSSASASYRPDIDGLRAVAVLLVLAFHLGISRVKGGYVGVDVFFVISGYLISAHILEELRQERFSLASFYERRIRRIFPALLVVLVATGVCAVLYLMPTELSDFGWSLGAAALSVSNVFFYKHSGYFAAPSSSIPLIHTWSLGVEEQFYLALPLLLLATWKINRRAIPSVVWLVMVLSLVHSIWLTHGNRDAGFYLASSRAWELLLGTLLAIGHLPGISRMVIRELAAAIGLLAILYAALFYGALTPFPGVAALVPCVGTVLIIAAGQGGTTFTTRALSLRPLVWVGLMSYSLYLWHWPLYVFESMGAFPLGVGGRMLKVVLALASFVVAFLSWRLVELPFRVGPLRLSRGILFRSAVAMVVGLCISAWTIVASGGFPRRFPAAAVRMAEFLKYDYAPPSRVGICMVDRYEDFDPERCVAIRPDRKNYLLLGDSHAAALWSGLSGVYGEAHVLQLTGSNCKIRRLDGGPTESCRKLMHLGFTRVMTDSGLTGVVLAARWAASDLDGLGESIAWMRERHLAVTVLGPVPQYDAPLPRLLALEMKNADGGLADRHLTAEERMLDRKMADLAKTRWHVPYISLIDVLCGASVCTHVTGDSTPVQYDYGHLTREGALFVAQRLQNRNLLQLQ